VFCVFSSFFFTQEWHKIEGKWSNFSFTNCLFTLCILWLIFLQGNHQNLNIPKRLSLWVGLPLVLLLLYAYGSSLGSAMTTIGVYLISISIPHCILCITLYWFFIFAFVKWTFTLNYPFGEICVQWEYSLGLTIKIVKIPTLSKVSPSNGTI